MKLFHISDLHIGKRLGGFSLLEDQTHILGQILEAIKAQRPDALLICGDVYDKSVPPTEAVTLFDGFLWEVSRLDLPVLVIGGNHDSIDRLSFGSRLMAASQVYIAPAYHPGIRPLTLQDEFGPVDFWLLPFIRPAQVRFWFPEAAIDSYEDAMNAALSALPLDMTRRNVLLTHQFVAGASLCDSEEFNVGALDSIGAQVFDGFDYVALGHIHGAQNVSGTIRYCGTPLKYSLSEEAHTKSITLVTLAEKGALSIDTLPLTPLREVRTLQGSFHTLMDPAFYRLQNTDDYLSVVLTDEDEIPEALGRIQAVYPHAMAIRYDNTRTRASASLQAAAEVAKKTPMALFSELYVQQNGRPMSQEQVDFMEQLIADTWRNDQ